MADLVMRLKGGLGNQMFQYAAGRAIARRHGMRLLLDTRSGFQRDRVYRRTFSLARFPLQARRAGRVHELGFWFERAATKALGGRPRVQRRPWGLYVSETSPRYEPVVFQRVPGLVLMEGHWQSESYFSDIKTMLTGELTVPTPLDERFLSLAREIERCASVAVGVRLFEEVPGRGKEGVGGLVPYSFYEDAARTLCANVPNPTFFVFSTRRRGVENKLSMPGRVRYVTHDDGYEGELERLWLISRCIHHIMSNSTFYWWGAWLAEQHRHAGNIIAADLFSNEDSIPARWTALRPQLASAPDKEP